MDNSSPLLPPSRSPTADSGVPGTRRFVATWMRRHQYLGAESPLLGTFRLREDLGLDSLDVVEFIVDLEAAYRITIPDEEVNQLTTIYLIEACVRRQLQASPPPPA